MRGIPALVDVHGCGGRSDDLICSVLGAFGATPSFVSDASAPWRLRPRPLWGGGTG